MWIHILIFLIFCELFFLSKGFFSKAGAFLAGKFPDFLQVTEKQLRLCLLVIFCGNVLGFFVSFMAYLESDTVKDGYLVRNEKGEGSYEEELVVSDGKSSQKIHIVVEEVPYTEEELQQFLDDAISTMDERILGENETLARVEYPLHLMVEIEGTPVTVEWNTDQPVYLDWEGAIGEDVPNEGVQVHLTGELYAGEFMRLYEKVVTVYPEHLPEDEALVREIEKQLCQSSEADIEYQQLPKEAGGKKLTWSKLYAQDGWLITGMAVLAGVLVIISEKSREKEARQKIEREMLRDYPLILNKLVLFMRAGVSNRMAIQRIVVEYQREKMASVGNLKPNHGKLGNRNLIKDKMRRKCNDKEKYIERMMNHWNLSDKSIQVVERTAYEELSRLYFEMEQGIPEAMAYERFGIRCDLMEYRTLATLLIQNLKKGSSRFLPTLEEECRQAFEERKRRALIAGEEAGTKLLVPMVMMLMVVLMIIMVPSFLSF